MSDIIIKDFLDKIFKKQIKVKEIIIGDNVLEEIYIKKLAINISASYIASAFCKCEFQVFENNTETKNEEYFKLNLSPNINQTSAQFWYKVAKKMLTEKEALVIITSDKNMYCADEYSIEEFPILGHKYRNIKLDNLTLEKTYKADEVFLFSLENEDIKKLIDGFHSTIGKALSHALIQYKKAGQEKYKLKIASVKAGDDEFNKEFDEIIKHDLKAFLENEKAVYPEFDGYELTQFTSPKTTSKDSKDIIELKKNIFETVREVYKIPKSLQDGNITNLKEVVKSLITFGVDPIAAVVEQEISRKSGYYNWSKGHYVKVDTSKINHIDMFDVAVEIDKLVASGVFCVDEIRKDLSKSTLDTEFSKTHFITKNYATAENSLKGGDNNEE